MLNLSSAKLTGTPGSSGWSQVHEFVPEDPEKFAARGHLYLVVATKRIEEGVETVVAGRELISRFHEEYFGDLSTKPFNALTTATQKVINEFTSSWGEVEVAACSVVGDVVFSSAGGGAKVMISRDGALATILESVTNGDVVSASGFPKKGDTIIVATKEFFINFPAGIIKPALQGADPESAAEAFAPDVHSAPSSGEIGVVIIKFGEKMVDVKAPAPIVATLKKSGNSLLDAISKLSKKLPERKIYIKPETTDEVVSQNKKLSFTVAIVLLVILAVSIGFGMRQKKLNDVRAKYQGILRQAQDEVDQAIGLASVSPDKSRELFSDSEQKLIEIRSLKVSDPKIDALEKKINDSRGAILGEYLGAPELFLDLSLLSSGFKGDAISASGGDVFILDKSGKKVVSVAISTKKSKVIAGPGVINDAFDIASYEGRVFILSSDGILEIDSGANKVVDKTWSGDAFIKAFAANLYILDKSGNAIYRYQGQGNSFGDQQSWLAAGAKVDFSDAKSWGVDGAMYVLYPNSKILKFSQGSPQSFRLSGVIPEIGTVDAIYADADNQNLYFLDKAGKRVVVTDKKGVYKAQHVDPAISQATNLVVSEAEKKIILLTGDKLLSLDLKSP